MTPTWLTNNYNKHFSNTWQSKGNQAIKVGQVIEYYKRNIFLKNSFRKWGRETSSRPFLVF